MEIQLDSGMIARLPFYMVFLNYDSMPSMLPRLQQILCPGKTIFVSRHLNGLSHDWIGIQARSYELPNQQEKAVEVLGFEELLPYLAGIDGAINMVDDIYDRKLTINTLTEIASKYDKNHSPQFPIAPRLNFCVYYDKSNDDGKVKPLSIVKRNWIVLPHEFSSWFYPDDLPRGERPKFFGKLIERKGEGFLELILGNGEQGSEYTVAELQQNHRAFAKEAVKFAREIYERYQPSLIVTVAPEETDFFYSVPLFVHEVLNAIHEYNWLCNGSENGKEKVAHTIVRNNPGLNGLSYITLGSDEWIKEKAINDNVLIAGNNISRKDIVVCSALERLSSLGYNVKVASFVVKDTKEADFIHYVRRGDNLMLN